MLSIPRLFGIVAACASCATYARGQSPCPLDATPDNLEPVPNGIVALGDIQAQEGIASDGSEFWTSQGISDFKLGTYPNRLTRFSSDWAILAQEDVDYTCGAFCILRHVGDIDVTDEYVYAPVTNFCDSVCGDTNVLHIAWFDRTTLEYQGHIDLSTVLSDIGEGDLAGVAVHDDTLYAVEYQPPGGSPPRILAIPLIGGVNLDLYPISTTYANGIAFFGGNLYVSAGTNTDLSPCDFGPPALCCPSEPCGGSIDVYDLASLSESQTTLPFKSYTYECPYTHAQGITFSGAELWVAQNDHVIQLQSPILDDEFEPNDVAAEATTFGAIDYVFNVFDVSATNDDDWFAFTTIETGTATNFVRIEFEHDAGDLDMCIYAADEATDPVSCSGGNSGTEQVSLAGLPPAAYLVRVYGFQAAANPCYDLIIDAPSATTCPAPGDCNADGDMDLHDYAGFPACLQGPDQAIDTECACHDLDGDAEVDLADFAEFQRRFGQLCTPGVWSAPVTIVSGIPDIKQQDLAVDADGTWHVVFRNDEPAGTGMAILRIYYANSTSLPIAIAEAYWDGPLQAGTYLGGPAIALDVSGTPHVTFPKYTSSPEAWSVEYMTNTLGGWSTPATIVAGVPDIKEQDLAVDANGAWHVVLRNDAPAGTGIALLRIYYANSMSLPIAIAEAYWDSPLQAGTYLGGPAIALDVSGTPHVTFPKYTSSPEAWSVEYMHSSGQ